MKNLLNRKESRPEAKNRKAEDLLFNENEISQIMKELKSRQNSPKFCGYYISYFAAYIQRMTGVRPSELFALEWTDIDWDYMVINVNKSQIEHKRPKQWFEIIESTKNEKGVSQNGRLVPISDELSTFLRDLKSTQDKLGIKTNYVLGNKNGFTKKKVYFDALNRTSIVTVDNEITLTNTKILALNQKRKAPKRSV